MKITVTTKYSLWDTVYYILDNKAIRWYISDIDLDYNVNVDDEKNCSEVTYDIQYETNVWEINSEIKTLHSILETNLFCTQDEAMKELELMNKYKSTTNYWFATQWYAVRANWGIAEV